MTDRISDEVVATAARAVITADSDGTDTWDDLTKDEQKYWLKLSRHVLVAALPVLNTTTDAEIAELRQRVEVAETNASATEAELADVVRALGFSGTVELDEVLEFAARAASPRGEQG